MQRSRKKTIFVILCLLLIGFITCFSVPKLERIAWRAISIGEFKTFRMLGMLCSKPLGETTDFKAKLASHRGVFSQAVAENSEESIIGAAKNKFRYIELDVSFSRDYIPFIFHDSNFKLKTNLSRLTSEVLWEDIESLKLSDGQRIISLQLFFSKYAKLFDGTILDIKGENKYFSEKASGFLDAINNYGYSKNIYVIGRPCGILSTIKKLCPELKVGCEDQGVLYNYLTGKDLISLHYATQFSLLEHFFAKKLNLVTILWTINNPQELFILKNLGNTIILTDLQKPYW